MAFATGGIITSPFQPTSESPYYTPNGTATYTFMTIPKVVKTVRYEKNGLTLTAEILSDGAIHVDPEAFDMLMLEAGFEKNSD